MFQLCFYNTNSLGTADLDNYCKAILDGITHTEKIWMDDKQVNELIIKREYTDRNYSFIYLEIVPM